MNTTDKTAACATTYDPDGAVAARCGGAIARSNPGTRRRPLVDVAREWNARGVLCYLTRLDEERAAAVADMADAYEAQRARREAAEAEESAN